MTEFIQLTPEVAERIWFRGPVNCWGHVNPAWHSAQFEIAQYENNKPKDCIFGGEPVMGVFDVLDPTKCQ